MNEPNEKDFAYELGDYAYKGVKLTEAGDLFGAEACYKEALSKSPDDAAFLGRLALVYMKMKANGNADKHFRKALAIDPKDTFNLCNYGNYCLKVLEKPQKAERLFLKALEIDPRYPAALNQLGFMYAKQYKDKEAENYLLRYVEVDKRQIPAYFKLGTIYKRQGRDKEAIKMFQSCISRKPKDVLSRYQLGVIFQKQGNYERAEYSYHRCIALDPKNVYARHQLALLYEQTNREDAAEAILEELVAIDGSFSTKERLFALRQRRIEREGSDTGRDEKTLAPACVKQEGNATASTKRIIRGNSDNLGSLAFSISK